MGDEKIRPLYRDGRHYDLLAERAAPDDIPFWLRQAERHGGPVLELGCGTGRVTIPIAEKGIRISGLDLSEPMLSHGREKARKLGLDIDWVHADCRDFDLKEKFSLIIFPYNAFHHLLGMESAGACLCSVKKHLAENGRFIIDLFNPSLRLLTRDPDKRHPLAEYPDPDGAGQVVMTETPSYNTATQIQRLRWHYKIGDKDDAKVEEWDMRIYYPQELDALIRYNGFEIEHKWGSYDESPFQSDSPKQIVVCKVKD
jgi:SAM-dependent methyltransferase